ncbi:MAG: FliM/FliN family flagellar motor switch protein [Candidatus Eremiobacteraeota bacterium]|nr:FliM/FliN family flagellar motor switch protein [Candidatus Eremiobacteraeota bacterium]
MSQSGRLTIEALGSVEVTLSAHLGSVSSPIRDLLALEPGALVTLNASADAPVMLLVNGVRIASGDIVVTDQGVLAVEISDVSRTIGEKITQHE